MFPQCYRIISSMELRYSLAQCLKGLNFSLGCFLNSDLPRSSVKQSKVWARHKQLPISSPGSCRKRTTRNNCCVFPFIYRGRRYNRCTRVNSKRLWCGITPNYDVDKLYGWCRGRGEKLLCP